MNQFKKFNVSFECRKAESGEMFSLDEDHYENTDSSKYRKSEWAPPKCEQETICHLCLREV